MYIEKGKKKYLMRKESITVICIYASNIEAPKYIK